MKIKVWLPCIVFAISLSSLTTREVISVQANNVGVKVQANNSAQDFCSIYSISSLIKNGEEIGSGYGGYLFYFCSDNTFSIYTDNNVTNGNWFAEGETLVINVTAPEESLSWVNGHWEILEQTDNTLALRRGDKEGFWVVRFEGRQR